MTNKQATVMVSITLSLALLVTTLVAKERAGLNTEKIVTKYGAINNPGNIRTEQKKYPGEIDSPNPSFKSFDTITDGFAAMIIKLRSYSSSGYKTLWQLINHWAPESDNNDPFAYVDFIINDNGFAGVPDDVVNVNDKDTMLMLILSMAKMEQGSKFISSISNSAWVNSWDTALQVA